MSLSSPVKQTLAHSTYRVICLFSFRGRAKKFLHFGETSAFKATIAGNVDDCALQKMNPRAYFHSMLCALPLLDSGVLRTQSHGLRQKHCIDWRYLPHQAKISGLRCVKARGSWDGRDLIMLLKLSVWVSWMFMSWRKCFLGPGWCMWISSSHLPENLVGDAFEKLWGELAGGVSAAGMDRGMGGAVLCRTQRLAEESNTFLEITLRFRSWGEGGEWQNNCFVSAKWGL